jgi:hypothetical protein
MALGPHDSWCCVTEHEQEGAQFLGSDPGGGDLTTLVAGLDAARQPRPCVGGKVLGAAARHPADPVQRVVAAAPKPAGLLLHPAAHVVDGGKPEPHDVEGIQYPHRVGQTGR